MQTTIASRRRSMLLAVLVFAIPVISQENTKKPCFARDEILYLPGVDGVKAPGPPQPDKKAKGAPDVRGFVSFELIINSEGKVCKARVIDATDRMSANQGAIFILEHWTFKPASKDGKPVAVKLTLDFDNIGHLQW